MTAFFRSWAMTALLLGLCACQQPRPMPDTLASPFPFDLPPSLMSSNEVLPSGREVCRQLGLNPDIPGRCNDLAVIAASARQTDRSLWFYKTSSGLMESTCPHSVDFSRLSGGRGLVTTVLCRQPDDVSSITEPELRTLYRRAEQLNQIQRKTLAQHTEAVDLKRDIACQVGTAVGDCD